MWGTAALCPPRLRCQRCSADLQQVQTQLRLLHGFSGLGGASRGGWECSQSLRGFLGENPSPTGCPLGCGLEHPSHSQLGLKPSCTGTAGNELVLPSLQLAAGVAMQTAKTLWMLAGGLVL